MMFSQWINRTAAVLATTVLLSACGGGGSSSTTATTTEASAPPEVPSAPPMSMPGVPQIIALSGVYDTSSTDDEAYLYIADDGAVIAYDYQGDMAGTGDNCYSLSTTDEQINNVLNGGVVTYASETDRYTLTYGDGDELTFNYNSTDGLNSFRLGPLSSGTGILLGDINIGGAGRQLQSGLLISDIESALCQ